jgi:hypothetical protein
VHYVVLDSQEEGAELREEVLGVELSEQGGVMRRSPLNKGGVTAFRVNTE